MKKTNRGGGGAGPVGPARAAAQQPHGFARAAAQSQRRRGPDRPAGRYKMGGG
jgi:hypothetical protein